MFVIINTVKNTIKNIPKIIYIGIIYFSYNMINKRDLDKKMGDIFENYLSKKKIDKYKVEFRYKGKLIKKNNY